MKIFIFLFNKMSFFISLFHKIGALILLDEAVLLKKMCEWIRTLVGYPEMQVCGHVFIHTFGGV